MNAVSSEAPRYEQMSDELWSKQASEASGIHKPTVVGVR